MLMLGFHRVAPAASLMVGLSAEGLYLSWRSKIGVLGGLLLQFFFTLPYIFTDT